ncbi:hypothetical protein KI688_005764 [Linnemannia hyalina]|uniref:Cyclin N-terminal domain-containing protein n=1 Tax=Linnemannia hyalina TaxID=64524 RepID=A0A9P7Y2J0_9FUNG|nr:hypothetical protein KI688_005764 [Linnemannia hyalina]
MVSEEKRKAIIDMADFATSMFLYILAEHEDSSTPASCDPTHKPSRRRKHTDMVKPIVKFRTFCVQVLWHTRRSPSTIILSLRFLHQIVSNLRDKNKRLTSKRRYEKRFFIGVLILADKFHNDGSLNNDCWSWLTGISMGKIRSIERQFLEILDYKVFVCAEEYTEWLACLVSMTKRHMPTQISVALKQQSIAAASSISPIDHTTTTKEPTPSIPKTTTTKELTPSIPKTTTTKKPTPSIPKTTTTKNPTPSIPKTTTTKKPTPSIPKTTTTKNPTPSIPKTTTKVVSPTPPVIQQDQGSSRRSDKASGSNRHPHLYSQKDGQSQGIEQSNSSKAPILKSTGRAANSAATAIVAGGKRTERLASASYTSKAASAAARHPTKATTTSNVPRPTNPARP